MSADLPTLLAIDSSTEVLCLAACRGQARQVWAGPGGAQASTQTLARAGQLLADLGIHWADLQAIGFGRGPGAFTGLRNACAVAQGLGFGLDRPLLPVDSLLIVAEAWRVAGAAEVTMSSEGADAADLGVVVDARMGEVYAARYRWQAQGWIEQMGGGLWKPDDLQRHWAIEGPRQVVGKGLALLGAAASPRERAIDDQARARALLSLAQEAWERGVRVPASEAVPLYLRDKVALTSAERAAVARDRSA